MQILHVKDPYSGIDDVSDVSAGLAVVSLFLQQDANVAANKAFQLLFESARGVQYQGTICKYVH